jgi:RNA polymerase sigma-70 factor (ECF subfamily)
MEISSAGPNPFSELLARVRSGDPQAVEVLVRHYEVNIRVAVRARIRDQTLRRYFDSQDVCQSVLASFFVRAANGQYDLDGPEQLLKLLVTMAGRKLKMQVRHWRQQRRDYRRLANDGGAAYDTLIDSGPQPDVGVCNRDLLQAVRQRMSVEERHLADDRVAGRDWAEIAAKYGGTPEARRKQYARTLDRIATDLGIDEGKPDDEP